MVQHIAGSLNRPAGVESFSSAGGLDGETKHCQAGVLGKLEESNIAF